MKFSNSTVLNKFSLSVAQFSKVALLAAGATLGLLGTSARATPPPTPTPSPCAISDVTGASLCAGYAVGNIFDSSALDVTAVEALLTVLGFDATSIDYSTLYADPGSKLSNLNGATSLSFGAAPSLYGETLIGIHWGGAGGGRSAIYKINLTAPIGTVAIIGQNPGGTSNATLFHTTTQVVITPPDDIPPVGGAVPEPATWALMIVGFGAMGGMMRRRSTVKASLRFA